MGEQKGFNVRVFLSVSHKLGAEVTHRKKVICPHDQLSVLLVENRQSVEITRDAIEFKKSEN